jgi:hypothetical protein
MEYVLSRTGALAFQHGLLLAPLTAGNILQKLQETANAFHSVTCSEKNTFELAFTSCVHMIVFWKKRLEMVENKH